ncbi:MAG: glycosyltransferase [Candidatus Aminicenantes bacterium]|nr:glycosyltransferase [Candidatus Aminicenantes bacterium]
MDDPGLSGIRHIGMLSTHGYFDPVPELGKTDTGGQVLYVLHLARALSQLGFQTDIFTRWFDRSKKQIDPLPDCPEVRVIRIPAGGWKFIAKEFIYPVLAELADNLSKWISSRNCQYDIFHGHYVDAGIVALEVARAFSKPCFFTAHSLGAWKRQRVGGNEREKEAVFNFTRRIGEERRIFGQVTAQTITSKEEGDKIKQLYDFDSPRTEFIPPGVDIDKFSPLAADQRETKTRLDLPEPYVFVVSRISKAKGHDLLLQAFSRVLRHFPDLHLVIAGGTADPDEEETEVVASMKAFIKTNRMEKNVHLVGGIPHDELPPCFRQARLFILPARYEPFGMTALEAMACGVPAVISKYSGIRENLVHEEDCLVVDPLEPVAYADSIIRLIRDENLVRRLVKNGLGTVRSTFSWESIARRHLEFYNRYIPR